MHALPTRVVLFFLGCLPAVAAAGSEGGTIKLASWNLEWLMTPETFSSLKHQCLSDDSERRMAQRQLPCDVASKLERSATDFATLARYANELSADVIAVQEVDGAAAARLVFRDHNFCFSSARALQNNGFAIRRGIPYRCAADYSALSLNDSVRRGVVVVLYPGTADEMQLMSVHLKSGCARAALDSDATACRKLAQQVGPLERWIDDRARDGARFAVLGDFNRELQREPGPARSATGLQREIWPEINDGQPVGATLSNAAAGSRFRNCASGQRHSGYIDQIVLGKLLAAQWVPDSFERLTWRAFDAARLTLSDHCPIAIRIQISSRH